MSTTAFESPMKSLAAPGKLQQIFGDEQVEVNQVANAAVRMAAGHRVGVKLLGELLLAADQLYDRLRYLREIQPAPRDHCFHWIENHIADSDIDVKPDESPAVDSRLDWVSRSTVRCGVWVQHCFAYSERKEVIYIE